MHKIGERKRRQLLEAFGSLEGVRSAAPEAIAALPGFSLKSAARIQSALQGVLTPSADRAEQPSSGGEMNLTTTNESGGDT